MSIEPGTGRGPGWNFRPGFFHGVAARLPDSEQRQGGTAVGAAGSPAIGAGREAGRFATTFPSVSMA